jgi:hypothetical protein
LQTHQVRFSFKAEFLPVSDLPESDLRVLISIKHDPEWAKNAQCGFRKRLVLNLNAPACFYSPEVKRGLLRSVVLKQLSKGREPAVMFVAMPHKSPMG